MIQVLCIVTSVYKEYFEAFINSFKFFFPNEEKILTLLTDDVKFVQKYSCDEKTKINTKYFPHLLYPTINLNKPVLFNDNLLTEAKYAFIIDVDTVFTEKHDKLWEELKVIMDGGEILLTKHPFYSMKEETTLWGLKKDELIHNLYTENLTEKDEKFSSYIPYTEYTYINSSFWGGNPESIKIFNNAIITLATMDLKRYPFGWHIPKFIDENYVNKIYWLQEKKGVSMGVDIHAGTFSVLGGDVKNNIADTVFMKQKNLASCIKAYS